MRGHRATTKTAELWAPVSSAADPPPSSQLISWFVFYLSLSSNKSESLAYMINNSKVTEYSDVQILYVMLFIIILCACENYNAVCLATVRSLVNEIYLYRVASAFVHWVHFKPTPIQLQIYCLPPLRLHVQATSPRNDILRWEQLT